MPTDPDQDILDLVDKNDDGKAIRLLMDRHGKAVYRYVCSELRNSANSDDIHLRIFREAHRDIRRFSRRSTLRSWLYGIARHRVLDERKSMLANGAKTSPLDDHEDPPVDEATPGEKIDDARLKAALKKCVELLKESVREAVRLRYLGMSFEELGELFNEKPSTIQARVTRALPVLKECIEKRTSSRL